MSASERRRLRERLDVALDAAPPGAALDAQARERLVGFVALLARWSRVWNLTAVREPLDMLDRHVLDALTLLPFVDAELARVGASVGPGAGSGADPGPGRDVDAGLIDVGSGAGLPVLVLAIARPTLDCLSIERTSKKARFQRQAILELGLDRVVVRDERVEAVRAGAPIVTSRAFAAPADFLAAAAPLTVPGGAALVMLGRAERMPEAVPEPWTLERSVVTGRSPERHVALCRRGPRDRIPYDPPP